MSWGYESQGGGVGWGGVSSLDSRCGGGRMGRQE